MLVWDILSHFERTRLVSVSHRTMAHTALAQCRQLKLMIMPAIKKFVILQSLPCYFLLVTEANVSKSCINAEN